MKQTIYIAADHAGFVMKESLKVKLEDKGYHIEDLGAHELNPNDDYPQFAAEVARAVSSHEGSLGILSCGNAEGVCIAANKFDGIRAGIGFSNDAAQTMREDDNANIVCIPGRIETIDDPLEIVMKFIQTPFSGAKRHRRRLAKLAQLEREPVQIVPAILVQNFDTFKNRITNSELRQLAPTWQIDILDGSMFNASSFAKVDQISEINDLPEIELHLMVQSPLPIIEEWKLTVPSLKRVIVHAEIDGNLESILAYIKNLGLEAGLALNPETPIKIIKPLTHLLDTILIMGINPGKSGQEFLGKPIIKKIKKASKKYRNLTIAVDGGVAEKNAHELIKAGAHQLCAASALWNSENPAKTFKNLSTGLL